MPKLRKKLPSYRLHQVSRQAVVALAGFDPFLGEHFAGQRQATFDGESE